MTGGRTIFTNLLNNSTTGFTKSNKGLKAFTRSSSGAINSNTSSTSGIKMSTRLPMTGIIDSPITSPISLARSSKGPIASVTDLKNPWNWSKTGPAMFAPTRWKAACMFAIAPIVVSPDFRAAPPILSFRADCNISAEI